MTHLSRLLLTLPVLAGAVAQAGSAQTAPPATPPPPAVRLGAQDNTLTLPDLDVVSQRLDAARQQIQPSLGANRYEFSPTALQAVPQGSQSSVQQVLLQAPGVATDSYGQIHVRDEHANVQYRLDGVQLPEGLSVFGQVLATRFAHAMSLTTGALPAQYGFNHAGVVDITTKSGATDPGGAIGMYGGARGTLQPSFEYGGRSGAFDYYVTGEYMHTKLGIENPTPSFNAKHDTSDQLRGLAHVSGIVDADTRISLLAGSFNGAYQIPTIGGQTPGMGLTVNSQSGFTSADLNERQRESSQFAILSLQKHAGDVDVQISAFTRQSSLYYSPDPLGDLLFNGIAQNAARSSWANGVQADASWQASDTHTVRLGFLGQVERTTARTNALVLPVDATGAQTTDQPSQIADGNALTGARYGFYLQDSWKLLPSLTLNYGARFDVVDEYTHDRDISPRINLVWQATPATTLHVGYSRYFTPPPFELVGGETLAKFAGTTGAPAVAQDSVTKSERAHYFDVGISQKLLPGLTLGVDAYYKISSNLIDEGQFGSPILLSAFNYQQGDQRGVELSASYDSGPWSVYANAAYARGVGKNITSAQFNFASDELAYIASHFIHLDHDQTWTGSAGAAYTIAADSDHPARVSADMIVQSGLRASTATVPNGAELPGYAVVNLSFVQSVRVVPAGPTELRLDVLNAFDHRYEIRDGTGVGVGAPQYGLRRTILGGVTQRF